MEIESRKVKYKKCDSNMWKTYSGITIFIIIVAFLSLKIGTVNISSKDIFRSFLGEKMRDESMKSIIIDVRLPRIIMAVLIGMLLASSGAVVQSVFQNPLADPYIIGISASATLGAVIAYIFNFPDVMYGICGFIVSVIVALIIFRISRNRTRTDVAVLLIVGIAISSFLGTFTSFSMYLIGQDSFRIVTWMMGYMGSVVYFYLKRYEMDLLMSGDEEAHSLGVNVDRLKRNLLIVSALIVGFSVAFTGMIGFVGLIAPHTVRLVLKSGSNTRLLPLSTLGGGLFLLICDTIGRTILAPTEIPIGVVTSFFGAPFFLYLAIRRKKGG